MDFFKFLVTNYVMIFELIGLLIILLISIHVPEKIKISMRITVALLFVATIAHNIEAWTHNFKTYNVSRPLLTSVKYSIYPIILLVLSETLSTEDYKTPLKNKILVLIPEIICVPLFFTSQWTHLVFYYDANNVYDGGPLKYLPYILFIMYYIIFIIKIIIYLKHYKTRDRIIALYITLASGLLIILYLIYDTDLDYTPIFTSASVFFFLFLYIHLSSIDPLTGLMNRQSYYKDITAKNDKIKSVIVVDMNELKYVNDTFGHDAGDEALKIIAKILLDHAGYHKAVYRTGGDEFVMLYSITDEEEIKNRITKMKEELAKTKYSCAFGYSMRNNKESVSDVIIKADNKMYIDKQQIKQEIINNGGEIHNRY